MTLSFEEVRPTSENVNGFISMYEHDDELEFISLGEGKQGYFDTKKLQTGTHMKNLIVAKASVFIANRMRPGVSWGNGITHLELGSGVGSGTLQNPDGEESTQEDLRVPLERKEITAWTYVDSAGLPTSEETNALEITTVFDIHEAVGTIVEMGLFGGNATDVFGSGFMFNYKTFPVWNKQSGMKLTIVWKLVF